MKFLKNIIAALFLLTLISENIWAQVGIDNSSPSDYAVLDIKADDKGILIPQMTQTERFALISTCSPNCPNGLMVFDSVASDFFYIKQNQWYALSAFITSDTSSATAEPGSLNLGIFSNVGLGTTPESTYILDVNGNAQHRAITNQKDSMTVNNGMVVSSGDLLINDSSLYVKSGDLYAEKALLASNFSSSDTARGVNGVIPKGGIIMWSGSIASIPTGWALCDGLNGTPNLKDKFVVGGKLTGTYAIGSTGGENLHKLIVSEIPAHTHTGSTSTDGSHSHDYLGHTDVSSIPFACDGPDRHSKSSGTIQSDPADYGGEVAGDHSHVLNLTNTGGNGSHENRPPYYALAYIMKL